MIRAKEAAETVAVSLGTKPMYTGAGVTVLGGLTSHEAIALAGLAVAVLGFLLNAWIKLEGRKRAKIEHEARMRRLALGKRTDTGTMPLEADD